MSRMTKQNYEAKILSMHGSANESEAMKICDTHVVEQRDYKNVSDNICSRFNFRGISS